MKLKTTEKTQVIELENGNKYRCPLYITEHELEKLWQEFTETPSYYDNAEPFESFVNDEYLLDIEQI